MMNFLNSRARVRRRARSARPRLPNHRLRKDARQSRCHFCLLHFIANFTLESSVSSESENEVESEEEEATTLYPLEDKYIDEADRHRCEVLLPQ
jgi:hypothetical protein